MTSAMSMKRTSGKSVEPCEKHFEPKTFSEYARRPAKYEEERREDRYERLEDDREYERRRNRDL